MLRIEGNINSNRYVRECYSPKSFLSFKISSELSFSGIMHAQTLQRLFEIPVQTNTCNFLFPLLFAGYIANWESEGYGWSSSHSWSASCSFKRRTLASHTSNIEFSSSRRHSKSVWFDATSCSTTYCSVWRLHQILISDTFFFALKILPYICTSTSGLCIKFHIFW